MMDYEIQIKDEDVQSQSLNIVQIKKENVKNELISNKKKKVDNIGIRKRSHIFTETDDLKVLQLVLKHGPKFQKIHRHFPGKTISMVKNRYYKYLRYKWELLGQNYKHLNIQQTNSNQEQQNIQVKIEDLGNDNILDYISARTILLQNSRLFVDEIKVVVPQKQINKTITLDHLNKLSKKIKTNNESEQIITYSSSSEDEPIQISQKQEISNGKLNLVLSQPKNKLEDNKFQTYKRKIPPLPPGINFKEAEILTNQNRLTQEEKELIDEYDKDDMFMQDQKTINEKGIVNVTYEFNEEENAQVMKLKGTNEKYWEMERQKMQQKEEAFMKMPSDVNQLKREKNHIDSLNYQAALKQDNYETKRQEFRDNKDKMRARYGW